MEREIVREGNMSEGIIMSEGEIARLGQLGGWIDGLEAFGCYTKSALYACALCTASSTVCRNVSRNCLQP